jgi:hypothetical protein
VNGQFTTSQFKVKLWQASGALEGHQGQAALLVSTQLDWAPQDARNRLSRALMALPELPANLNSANSPMRASGGR